ncbi:MAG: LacI family DNA-binding transcriptional regulator [Protaetiibacter sp.]
MVTQQDVAERAGVGRRTVSHVITGFPHVSADARRRVLQAIDELGYVPNRAAQQLRTGRSGVIALTVPEIGVGYFGELATLVVEDAAARGLGTVVAQTRGIRERELAELERILALQPDGVIMSPLGLTADDLRSIVARVPVALIGEHFVGRAGDGAVPPIAIDNAVAAASIAGHLVELGRRRVAFLGMPGGGPRFNELRRTGARDALARAGLAPLVDVELADFTWEHGYRAGTEVAARVRAGEADAVFCVTDEVAIGVIRALHDAGLRVPDDVAVAGFDDIPEGRFAIPRLTTVAPDKAEIARRAVATVLGEAPAAHAVPHRLEPRESTLGR